jgi:sugar phosphate isomerase/epimerase
MGSPTNASAKIAIQHSMLPGKTLSEKFQRAAEFGYSGVELTAWGFQGRMYEHLDEVFAASQSSGLPVSSLCTMDTDDFVHPDPKEREKRLDGLVNNLKFADDVGALGVVALPIRPPLHLPNLTPVADERALITQVALAILRAALQNTPGARAAIFLEPLNRYEAYYLRTIEQAAELCTAVGDPRVQVMADMFHMNIEQPRIEQSLEAVGSHVGHVHLADSNRQVPGLGHTDFVAPFRALQQAGFSGWMSMECGVPGDPAQTLPKSVAYLNECWERARQG